LNRPLSFRRRLGRWRRAALGTPVRALAVCVVFGSFILAGIYAAREHTMLFQSLQGAGPNGSPASSGAVAKARLSGDGIGQVMFLSASGDNCRRVLFDNRTGLSYETKEVSCGPVAKPVIESGSPNRLAAVRKSFQR
jgi:hypothetical protein